MRLHYYLLTAAYCAAIFWISGQSEPLGPDYRLGARDKPAHAVLFGGLAAVVSVGMRRSPRGHGVRAQFFVPILFATGYGFLDEFHQYFVPQRAFDPFDIVADAAGAILAQALLFRWWGLPVREAFRAR